MSTIIAEYLPDWKVVLKHRDQLPECVKIWKEYLKSQIKELQDQLNKSPKIKQRLTNEIYSQVPLDKQWIYEMVADVFYFDELPKLRRDLKSLTFKLNALESRENLSQGYNEAQIEQAKSVKIEDIFPNPLRKVGGRLVGRCPFHQDKTPSFSIYSLQNSFYCFAESWGGDIITYIQKKENLNFKDAIRFLLQ